MPWIPLIAAGIGAAVTVGKMANDNAQANRQNRIRADEMQYSPWTHMKMGPMDLKTSDPFGTGASAVGPLGSATDDALKARSLQENNDKVDDKMGQASKTADSFTLPHFGSQLDQKSPGLTHNEDPNILYYKDNGSKTYNEGTPVFADKQFTGNDQAQQQMAGAGNYWGYDPNQNGIYFSPYGRS